MGKTQVITDVTVDRISLVSSKNTPAVPIATNEYAIFKMFGAVHKTEDLENEGGDIIDTKPKVEISKDIEKKLNDSINLLLS